MEVTRYRLAVTITLASLFLVNISLFASDTDDRTEANLFWVEHRF
jgi:hypothetical protein